MVRRIGWGLVIAALAPGCYCSHLPSRFTYGEDGGNQPSDADTGTRDAAEDAGRDAGGDGGPPCPMTCGGECTDINTDPDHCGSCTRSCSAPTNGIATCVDGACGFECEPGYVRVLAACEPLSAPRPIAPLSTSTATSQRPTFRWELPPRTDGARLEICADRACTSVIHTVDAAGTEARPTIDLPRGLVFWRLYGRMGTEVSAEHSVTWQLHVGARSAPVDTSWGSVLDLDGDGFADVLVGAPLVDSSTGRAYLFRGGASGVATTPEPLVSPPGAPGSFGASLASAGDVDGDGYADVVIGAPGPDATSGAAYVYHGGPDGVATTPTTLAAPEGGRFGAAVASAGDVDRDGYGDVIIGAYAERSAMGSAYLYRGGPTGLSATPMHILSPVGAGANFGAAVASAGDIDGDGYSDVVVGASGVGRAYLYAGGPGGLGSDPLVLVAPDGGSFGGALGTAGDVDGDGFADVAIAAASLEVFTGRVYVYRGRSEGLDPTPRPLSAPDPDGAFGTSIAWAGDLDADGFADLIVGAPTVAASGRAYVYRGSAAGHSTTPIRVLAPDGAGGSFGGAVAGAGDVDGDGFADVVVGAFALGSGAGRAYVFRGNAGGVGSTSVSLLAPDGGQFGAAVAAIWLRPMPRPGVGAGVDWRQSRAVRALGSARSWSFASEPTGSAGSVSPASPGRAG